MEKQNLLIENLDGIALLTVNRPHVLNALSNTLLAELLVAFEKLNNDDAVKVVVITGSGNKAFIAGADISEVTEIDSLQALDFSRRGQELVVYLGKMTKPVIAAVNGFALGGGLELALACDFIYASEKAKFGLPEVTLGVIPGFGGTQKLARIVGRNRANEMIFSAKILNAEEAEKWGIVNAVVPAVDLLDMTVQTARKIAENGLLSVAQAKCAIKHGLDMCEEDGMRYESGLFAALFSSKDQKEGTRAFSEKRKPHFTGS